MSDPKMDLNFVLSPGKIIKVYKRRRYKIKFSVLF